MIKHSFVVIALAIATGTAAAQPGATPPTESPPPPPAGVDAQVQTQTSLSFDPDAYVEQFAAAAPALENVARGTFRRARRAISIGPTLGLYGMSIPSPGDFDYAITFGIGLEKFKVPVLPTFTNLKALVKERAKAKVKEIIVARFKGQPPPSEQDMQRLVAEVWEEAVKEILGLENIRPKTMERPSLSVGIEGHRLLSSDVWAVRLRAGVGVSRFTVAGSIGYGFVDPGPAILGIEAVVHFLMSKNPRASVFDVFLRGDFEVRHRDVANSDAIVLGVRYLLDII